MRLLFDLMATQPSSESSFHGGGEYAKVVFKELVSKRRDYKDIEIICFYDRKRSLDSEIKKIIRDEEIRLYNIDHIKHIYDLISQFKIERFYSALPYNYGGLRLHDVEFICTIHGLRALEMPTDRYEIYYALTLRDLAAYVYKQVLTKRYLLKKTSQFEKLFSISNKIKIIVPSVHTKHSLLVNFPLLRQRGTLIYVLYSPRDRNATPSGEDFLRNIRLENKEYFLLVSGNRWLKNCCRAVKAFDEVFTAYPEINKKVLILGVPGNKLQFRFNKSLMNKDRFIFYDYVERPQLEQLYKSAFCFVYPTLNEGFGYPPLESMKYGTPVIASAITSITEICQDGVLYFNPFSIDEIKNRILQVCFEHKIYHFYSQKGKEVAHKVALIQDMMLQQLIDILLS